MEAMDATGVLGAMRGAYRRGWGHESSQFTPGECYGGPQSDGWLSVYTSLLPFKDVASGAGGNGELTGQLDSAMGCQTLAHASCWV